MYLRDYLKNKITDNDVKAEYEKFKKANAGKLEVHAYQIVLPTKIEAEQVIKDLDAGKKFEDLARQRSSDSQSAAQGGDIGYFAKDELPEPFQAIADAAFSLKPGQYTKEPIKSDFGWHVIKVSDRRERKIPGFDSLEMKIRESLSQKAIGTMVMDLRKKAKLQFFDMDGKPMTAEEVKKDAEKGPDALKKEAAQKAADKKTGDKKADDKKADKK
jgi:peptidyl-prolyl cis-trans isomerase C